MKQLTFSFYTKVWDIWVQGYLITGMEGVPMKARKVASIEASSFDEAVQKHVDRLPPDQARYWRRDARGWSHWGCQAYDNEQDARKSYG